MHPRTPNIGAVARAAGVSVGTVSNALNTPDRLAPETLDRVLGIIDELGYIRSSAGRTLIRNAADDFSLIVPDIDNSLFVDIARGAQLTAAESGQRLVMANSGFSSQDLVTGRSAHDAQDDFLGYFAEARSGGVLVCAMRDPTAGIARIRNHVRPIVVVNFDVPGADWCTVLMDNEQAGRIAVEHIADLGIEHAIFVSIPDVVQPAAARRSGVRQAAARRGVAVTEVDSTALTEAAGRAVTSGLIDSLTDRGERTALLFLSDDLAIGALQVLRARPDLRIPDDVVVMGMDGDHRPSGNDWMTMTSIELPGYEMGAEGVRLLTAESDPSHTHEHVVLPVRIRPGETTVGH
ncbi:MAG: LacI family DNA-binding transcriptional regulator [Microbacterium gubbeenense]